MLHVHVCLSQKKVTFRFYKTIVLHNVPFRTVCVVFLSFKFENL